MKTNTKKTASAEAIERWEELSRGQVGEKLCADAWVEEAVWHHTMRQIFSSVTWKQVAGHFQFTISALFIHSQVVLL